MEEEEYDVSETREANMVIGDLEEEQELRIVKVKKGSLEQG